MNLIERLSHMYELHNIFKGFIDYAYVMMILSYILVKTHDDTHTPFAVHLLLDQ
jgi:hypothetical protein